MKTIVAGSRKGVTYNQVRQSIDDCEWEITEIVSGTASGVDTFGEQVADEMGIPVSKFPANWKDIEGKPEHLIKENYYGKYYVGAGCDRNEQMAEYADALICVTTGSNGSKDMIKRAEQHGLLVKVVKV